MSREDARCLSDDIWVRILSFLSIRERTRLHTIRSTVHRCIFQSPALYRRVAIRSLDDWTIMRHIVVAQNRWVDKSLISDSVSSAEAALLSSSPRRQKSYGASDGAASPAGTSKHFNLWIHVDKISVEDGRHKSMKPESISEILDVATSRMVYLSSIDVRILHSNSPGVIAVDLKSCKRLRHLHLDSGNVPLFLLELKSLPITLTHVFIGCRVRSTLLLNESCARYSVMTIENKISKKMSGMDARLPRLPSLVSVARPDSGSTSLLSLRTFPFLCGIDAPNIHTVRGRISDWDLQAAFRLPMLREIDVMLDMHWSMQDIKVYKPLIVLLQRYRSLVRISLRENMTPLEDKELMTLGSGSAASAVPSKISSPAAPRSTSPSKSAAAPGTAAAATTTPLAPAPAPAPVSVPAPAFNSALVRHDMTTDVSVVGDDDDGWEEEDFSNPLMSKSPSASNPVSPAPSTEPSKSAASSATQLPLSSESKPTAPSAVSKFAEEPKEENSVLLTKGYISTWLSQVAHAHEHEHVQHSSASRFPVLSSFQIPEI
eukprot:ANDGO_01781.mRNA.1 hypothetical protein